MRGSPLISIILTCGDSENVRRMLSKQRGKTKSNDVDILRNIRRTEDLCRFRGTAECDIDVTNLSVNAAAHRIADFLTKINS